MVKALWTAWVLCLAVLVGAASAEVVMVFGVERHAARNVLPKTSNLQELDATGGPTLLPQGSRQAFDAGAAFQLRYLNATACGATCLAGANSTVAPRYGLVGTPQGAFNAYNTLVRSSGLDRTISTARAFLDGAFPADATVSAAGLPDGQQIVPVYSLGEDPLIRAYTQCPAYIQNLQRFYASDEFAQKAEATTDLRDRVATAAPALNNSLANWYNVWDGFAVNREYGVGSPMPAIDNSTFAEMQDLAYWLETAKMRSSLTGDLLGGLLLGDLAARLQAAANAATNGTTAYSLCLVVSHYNTQLGLLGALGVDRSPAAASIPWLSKLPEFAAIMVFELHADRAGGGYAVRLVAQDGPQATYQTIPLPCASARDAAEALAGVGACTLDSFLQAAAQQEFAATEAWCSACSNAVVPACRVVALQQDLVAASGGGWSCGSAEGWRLALAAVLPALAVAVAAAAAFVVYRRRARRRDAGLNKGLRAQGDGGDRALSAEV